MENNIDRQYLFVLPVPLMSPAINARLGGIAFFKTDATFNIIGKKEFIACRTPPFVLPSANFLYTQAFVPNSYANALCEKDFFDKVIPLFKDNNITIITFSQRYMQILKSIALRCFKDVDIFKNVFSILDIKVALQSCNLFGNVKTKAKDSIMHKAFELNFKFNNDDIFSKLDALYHVTLHLLKNDNRLLTFLMQNKDQKYELIDKSIKDNTCLFTLDSDKKEYFIFKTLKRDDNLLYALKLDFEKNKETVTLDLDDAKLIAPTNILTDKRCSDLNINKDAIIDKLLLDEGYEENFTNPFYKDYLVSLSEIDTSVFNNIKNKGNILNIDKRASTKLKHRIFLFKAENQEGLLLDSERQAYYQYCVQALQKEAPRYMKECELIINNLNENDSKAFTLMNKISNYITTL